ncbi:hypothetical protein DFH07DRAFT_131552 [Mycena maculata]|uniref:Uncharacterized protein n=1 Tax=Mycena maculata TaxID=230809 RepID=A0AAD7I2P4_9AGAR|nr:hypothetical protein DFH07DRAFT_131552 [Mycena maculata]
MTLNNHPPIFNLSMVVGGQVSSVDITDPGDVRVVPAWGATITNNSIIPPSAVQNLPANLTTNGTSTSASASHSALPSASSSVVNSRPVSSVANSASAQVVRSTASQKQARAFSPINAVAKDQSDQSSQTPSSPSSPSPQPPAASSSIKGIQHTVSSGNDTTPSSSASAAMPSTTDPLGNIPNTLKGNLMMFSINPGSWADDLASNVAFAVKERPDVTAKYFGNGTNGMGPIGQIWTHICVITTDDPSTPGLNTVQVLGKMWDVLPALKGWL